VRTVISLLSYVAAFAAARILSPVIAEYLFDAVLKDAITQAITKELSAALESGQGTWTGSLSGLPVLLLPLLPYLSELDIGGLALQNAGQIVDNIVETALRDPVVSILGGLLFLLVFSAALMLARSVSRLFVGLYRVPLIGMVDTLLGGIAGALQAVLILYLCSVVIKLALSLVGDGFWWMNEDVLKSTYIWYAFM